MLVQNSNIIKKLPILIFSIGIVMRSSGGSVPFISPIAFVIAGVLLSVLVYRDKLRMTGSFLHGLVPVFLFIGYSFFSLTYTNSPNYGLSKISWLLFWLVTFIVMGSVIIDNFRYFLKSIIISQILLLVSLYFYFGSPFDLLRTVNQFFRLGDESTNPITFSRILGFTTLSTIFYLSSGGFKGAWPTYLRWVLFSPVLILSLMYMFFSGSKGPILSLFLSLIVYFVLKYRVSIKTVLIFSFFGVFTIGLISLIGSNSFLLDFIAFRFIDSETSFTSREVRLFAALGEVFSNKASIFNILFGAGAGNFSYFYDISDTVSYPHNLIVEILYELGFVGLFLFGIAFVKPIVSNLYTLKYGCTLELLVMWIYLFGNSMVSGDISTNFLLFGVSILFVYVKRSKYVV